MLLQTLLSILRPLTKARLLPGLKLGLFSAPSSTPPLHLGFLRDYHSAKMPFFRDKYTKFFISFKIMLYKMVNYKKKCFNSVDLKTLNWLFYCIPTNRPQKTLISLI